MSEVPDPSPETISLPDSDSPLPPPRKRKWIRYVIYTLALLGVLLIALLVAGYVKQKSQPERVSINETEVIDSVMTRNYGKYSEEKKGWLYVAPDNRNYLVQVIQQAKPQDGPTGDELYFVASGTPLDGEEGGMYGVFQVRASDKPGETGTLVEISSPYTFEGSVPVRPEGVHFEGLSDNLWGWVIKVQQGKDPKSDPVEVRNVVLAPHGEAIATLATFKASRETDPGVSCDAANDRYREFKEGAGEPTEPVASTAASAEQGGTTEAAETEPEELPDPEEAVEPVRCDKATWSYSTGASMGNTPGPLTVTFKGMLDGAQQAPKTWKLIFDTKAFSYNVPAELVPSNEP
jgi:hypothetical protein